MNLHSTHRREAGHFVAAVDGVTGIGDVVERGKHLQEAERLVGEFQVEQRIVLVLHVL